MNKLIPVQVLNAALKFSSQMSRSARATQAPHAWVADFHRTPNCGYVSAAMTDPASKSRLQQLKELLPLLSSLGLPVGGAWAAVLAFWKSATGEWAINKRLLLVLSAAVVSLAVFGVWWLVKQRRRLLLVRDSSSAPFKVSDDYEFDTDGGFWIERKTKLRVCASCLLPPTKIVSPLFEAVGLGLDGEEELVWRCVNCRSDYFHKHDHET